MIALGSHPDGVILPVRAQPGAKKSEIRGEQTGMLKVAVTQSAEQGKANKALFALICRQFGIRKSQVELLSGETSRQKRLLIRGISCAELQKRIATALVE